MASEFLYITFQSVHDAMRAECFLTEAGFEFQTVPVPREIRPDCGIAIRFELHQRSMVESFLKTQEIHYADLVQV